MKTSISIFIGIMVFGNISSLLHSFNSDEISNSFRLFQFSFIVWGIVLLAWNQGWIQ
jgi:hypothetical protein